MPMELNMPDQDPIEETTASTMSLLDEAMKPAAEAPTVVAPDPEPTPEPAQAAPVPMLPEELRRLRILDSDFDVPDIATARRLMERGRIEELNSPRAGRELKAMQELLDQKRPVLEWHEQYGDLLEDETIQRLLWARKNGLDLRSVLDPPQEGADPNLDPNDPLVRRLAGIENVIKVQQRREKEQQYEVARTTVSSGYEKWRADHNKLGTDGTPLPGHLTDDQISSLVAPYFEELVADMKPGEITRPGKMELTLERAYRLARHDAAELKLKDHGETVARATLAAQDKNRAAAEAAARPAGDSGQGTVPAIPDFNDESRFPPTRKGHRDIIGSLVDSLRGK